MHPQELGNQSRVIALQPNTPAQVLSVPTDPNDRTTWVVACTNNSDANQAIVTLTSDYLSPSGVQTAITTEIGPREEVQLYVCRAVMITAVCAQAVSLDISIFATGGNELPVPPQRFTGAVGVVAYVNQSPNNGCAPAGLRWFTIMTDSATSNYDVRILEGTTGNILFDVLNLPGTTIFGPFILPPGTRLTAKGTVGAPFTMTTTWSQTRGA